MSPIAWEFGVGGGVGMMSTEEARRNIEDLVTEIKDMLEMEI